MLIQTAFHKIFKRCLQVVFLLSISVFVFADATENKKQKEEAVRGERFFLQQCADCHGMDGMGRVENPKVYHCFRCDDERELSAYISARMPPGRRSECVGECAEDVADYILSTINTQPEPERTAKKLTVRRLNKRQYNNTVRDLSGLELDLADEFPEDDFGNGFDRMGDVLSLSPLQLELYIKAASTLANEIVNVEQKSVIYQGAKPSVLSCDFSSDTSCLNSLIDNFASKAWRRPIDQNELLSLVALFESFSAMEASDAYIALSGVFQAVLSSPNFIFQIENPAEQKNQYLSQFEIANRLSYFLWDSMPDDKLFELAASNQLSQAGVLKKQVDRMLLDKKSDALIEGFFGQWLLFNALGVHHVDKSKYGAYDEQVQNDLLTETTMVLLDYIRKPLPFKQILNNEYTYANANLAEFYQLKGDFNQQFQKVDLIDYPERFGLLSQGSLLTVTSHPHRTSVVKRGKWVMSNFLCEDPPPPPPGVEGLSEKKTTKNMTLRERMNVHSADPTCKSCHVTMDAIGFAMENYDAVGLFRREDNGVKIDSRGAFTNGEKFANAEQLSAVLADDQRFDYCVAEKLYIYALSSGMTTNDRIFLEEIVGDWRNSDQSLRGLTQAIVTNDAFLRHSPDPDSQPALSQSKPKPNEPQAAMNN